MKTILLLLIPIAGSIPGCYAQQSAGTTHLSDATERKLFLDVHDIGPGKVTFDAVADAHDKDLATESEYDVHFIKYWVDEDAGKVYCLAESPSSANVFRTHEKAHGLLPDYIMEVSAGVEAEAAGRQLFLDVHNLTPGDVTAEAVAEAHEKDLAVQKKYGVNFINYWVDERLGTVVCLSEATDSLAVVNTHKEAHGLLPSKVKRVKQGM